MHVTVCNAKFVLLIIKVLLHVSSFYFKILSVIYTTTPFATATKAFNRPFNPTLCTNTTLHHSQLVHPFDRSYFIVAPYCVVSYNLKYVRTSSGLHPSV